jgi:hypothetical protein
VNTWLTSGGFRGRRGVSAIALGVVLGFALLGCSDRGAQGVVAILDGDHHLEGWQPAALIILGGSVTLVDSARVGDSVWVLGGTFYQHGEISGDLAVLGGIVELGSAARIDGDLILSGGSVAGLGQVQVGGEVTEQIGLNVPLSPAWEADQSREVQVAFAGLRVLVIAAFAALLAILVPRPLRRVETAVRHEPLPAVALGILGLLVGLPLVVFMALTVVLLPVALVVLLLLVLSVAYGWSAIGLGLARALARRPVPPPIAAALGAGGLALLAELLSRIPLMGSVLAITLATTGFGAVLLTRLGLDDRAEAPAAVEHPAGS